MHQRINYLQMPLKLRVVWKICPFCCLLLFSFPRQMRKREKKEGVLFNIMPLAAMGHTYRVLDMNSLQIYPKKINLLQLLQIISDKF